MTAADTGCVPATLGPYRVRGLIGAGGMGVVYEALAPDGRVVAVKVLRASLGTADLLRRFQREARIRVAHDNVVAVLDAGVTDDGAPYLVLERLDGETLAQRLQRGRLSPAEAVALGVQACRGLAAAHAAGIVHRDVKPSNLFLCRDGRAKLIDFGIALVEATDTRLTASGGVLGTIGYIAPEVAEGRGLPDARADLWSVGAILYEALAGRPPFVGATPLATIVALLLTELEPLRAHAPTVPPALAAVVERALRRDPGKRFADAAALAEALAAADLAAPEAPPDPAELARDAAPEERRVVALILADGVRDRAALAASVKAAGGELAPLYGDRALAVFGGAAWEGDEVTRAATVALATRSLAARMAVASGWVTRSAGGIAGAVLQAAERGCAAGLSGVAVDAEAARGLGDERTLVPAGEGLWELARGSSAPVGGPIPTIGRESELAELRRAVRTVVLDRTALAVLLVGPIGSGKSRLRRELERLVVEAGLGERILSARAEPHRQGRRLSLLETLARAAGLGALGALASDPDATLQSTPPGGPATDPQTLLDRARVALLDALEEKLADGPLFLVLEDVHWADRESLDLFAEVLGELGDAPILVLATARPELLEDLAAPFGPIDTVRMEVRGLLSDDVADLVRAASRSPLSDDLVRAIAERTGGNPFFVLEMVRALADVEGDPSALPLPLTVEAAVQSRLDHLPADDKELCKRAAVLGRPFSAEEIAGLGVDRALDVLASLSRRELVVARARRGAAPRWELKSSLVAAVAYSMLTAAQRVQLHARAAAVLGAAGGADPEELARHHEEAGASGLAAAALVRAALGAARRGDVRAVLRAVERALALGAGPEHHFGLHMAAVDALRFLGRRDEQGAALEAALAAATTDGQRARALGERSVWLRRAGRVPEALARAEEAVAAARRGAEPEVLALARGRQSLALLEAGRFDEARAALDEAGRLATGLGPALEALVLEWTAQLASAVGDLGVRRAAFARLVKLHQDLGDLRRAAGAEVNLADVWSRVGAYDDAVVALRAARESCRRIGQRVMEGYALVNLGYALAMTGDAPGALAALDEGGALAAELHEARLAALAGTYRARALQALGRADEAAGVADETAAAAERAGAPGLSAGALSIAARAHLDAGRVPEAIARSLRALEIRDAQGSLEEDEAEVFLTRAAALGAAGDEAQAAEVLARGRARLEEIARGISDPELRARFLGAVPAHRELLGGASSSMG